MKRTAMTTSADERLDRVFGALADGTRRQLLAQLARGPASITELARPHDMSLPGVSKHVRVLEQAGLVRRRIDGRIHRCTLDAGAMRAADEWIARYRAFWDHALGALAGYVSEETT
jgi:DNA-binding transcriptional ArsR family regulator